MFSWRTHKLTQSYNPYTDDWKIIEHNPLTQSEAKVCLIIIILSLFREKVTFFIIYFSWIWIATKVAGVVPSTWNASRLKGTAYLTVEDNLHKTYPQIEIYFETELFCFIWKWTWLHFDQHRHMFSASAYITVWREILSAFWLALAK